MLNSLRHPFRAGLARDLDGSIITGGTGVANIRRREGSSNFSLIEVKCPLETPAPLSERTANVGVTIQKYPIRGEPHDARHLNAVTDITDRARFPIYFAKRARKLPRIYELQLFLPRLDRGNFSSIYAIVDRLSNDFRRFSSSIFRREKCQ